MSLIHNNAKRIHFNLSFACSLLFFIATKNTVGLSHENVMMRRFCKRTATDGYLTVMLRALISFMYTLVLRYYNSVSMRI